MSKDTFDYNHLLKLICEKLTNHRYRKLTGWEQSFSNGDYKYANRHDFYYKCRICGYFFFNHKPTKKELEYIKKWDKEN